MVVTCDTGTQYSLDDISVNIQLEHIMSDGWPAYHNLDQLNGGVYIHDVVIHEQNFVDPLHPEVHTQNVENMWMRAKRKLRRQFGTARPLFITYLEEFLWMQQHRNRQRRLSSLLVCIRDQNTHEQMHTSSELRPAVARRHKTALFGANHTFTKELLHYV